MNSKKWIAIAVAASAIAIVLGFRAIGTANDDAPYYLLYKQNGTVLNTYQQSGGGIRKYQYARSMESIADIIGDDRTADIHAIKRPDDAVADVEIDMKNLEASEDAIEQFTDFERSLLGTIKSDFSGSKEVKNAMTAEVKNRIETIESGDLSYRVPINSHLELSEIEYADSSENDKPVIAKACIESFVYKKKSKLATRDGEGDFSQKNMTSALMWEKDLREIPMYGTWFCQAVFAESNIAGGNMSNTLLTGALFIGNDLTGCNLSDANMSGTVFVGDDLTGANLENVNFSGTVFKSFGNQKVKIDSKWKEDILASAAAGFENIEWVN